MSELSLKTDIFVKELDVAVEAHMNWTRRILRCVALRTPPGVDVLDPQAHLHCRFGKWAESQRSEFDALDAEAARRMDVSHQAMHDAIRSICSHALAGLTIQNTDLDAFEQSQSELISLTARFKTLILSNAMQHDPLTGLPMRYGIERDFTLYYKDSRRNQDLLYVVVIDVDHFKRINDSYGHPVGDLVLRQLANTMKRNLRGNEPLYRYGGEEFLWLMQCKTAEEASQSALRLLTAIRTSAITIPDAPPIMMTATLGLAQVAEHEDLSSAVKRADAALYEGKHAGRDRFVIAKT
jgi:diguanylate cyclase